MFRKDYQIAKRIFDLMICFLTLPILLLVISIFGLLIYLDDPGPIFFKQMRTGKGGRRFGMYKFRTMVTNAEELKMKYAHLNELTWPDFKITDDPRVTRVGRFLRKSSLDELPQVINVIKGDMSLVGPRPEMPYLVEKYQPWQSKRFAIPPGITDWWQVNGGSDKPMHLHTEHEFLHVAGHPHRL